MSRNEQTWGSRAETASAMLREFAPAVNDAAVYIRGNLITGQEVAHLMRAAAELLEQARPLLERTPEGRRLLAQTRQAA